METIAFSELMSQTESELSFLTDAKYSVMRELIAEHSFRGGFRLTFTKGKRVVSFLYSEMQVEVHVNDEPVFDHRNHEGFAGNMFSAQSFSNAVGSIVESLKKNIGLSAREG